MGKAFISGVAATPCGKLPDESCLSLHAKVAQGAVADAGLTLKDVDGLLCAYSFTEPHPMLAHVVAEYLGIAPSYAACVAAGGASGGLQVMTAKALVEAGMCRNVLCLTGDNRLTGMPPGAAVAALADFGHGQYEVPYGITIPAAYGLVAQRYMHDTGLTLEQMAHIAVTTRNHARRHPGAQMRKPLTVEDVMASRPVAEPLRLFDCALISDGAAGILVSADAPDAARAVRIAGAGQKGTHEHMIGAPRDLQSFGCKHSAADAFAEAGMTVADIDVAEIYDSFTITLAIELESIGFFKKGMVGPAAAEGALDLGGSLPCNTHGGLLSYGHSGAAGGSFHIVEGVQQLRGEADERQVPDAATCYVHGDGGTLSAHVSLILEKMA